MWLLAALATAAHGQRAFAAGAAEATKLQTKDGVELSITYYPSRSAKDPALGKQVTPVVLLHDEKDTQGMFSSLVARLQAAGQAGESAVVRGGDGRSARPRGEHAANGAPTARRANSTPRSSIANDLLAMSAQDMEAVRGFLVGKNDAGELNLNKLCLVGVGLGATVAVNWAAQDWSAPPLLGRQAGPGREGTRARFAAVEVSAASCCNRRCGWPISRRSAAWMLIYGEQDPDQATDAKRIYRQLERFHPEPESAQGPPRGLVEMPFQSALEGSGLMSQIGAADRRQHRQLSDDARRRPGTAVVASDGIGCN